MNFVNKKLDEFENYIRGKKVAIIGLGVSNIPLIDYFYNLGASVSTLCKSLSGVLSKKLNTCYSRLLRCYNSILF